MKTKIASTLPPVHSSDSCHSYHIASQPQSKATNWMEIVQLFYQLAVFVNNKIYLNNKLCMRLNSFSFHIVQGNNCSQGQICCSTLLYSFFSACRLLCIPDYRDCKPWNCCSRSWQQSSIRLSLEKLQPVQLRRCAMNNTYRKKEKMAVVCSQDDLRLQEKWGPGTSNCIKHTSKKDKLWCVRILKVLNFSFEQNSLPVSKQISVP